MNTATITTSTQANKQLRQLHCITALGGGHGLGRLLFSLSFMRKKLVGVVATTDNGGSTGLLRDAHECIAWGDIRNCLSQLAQQPLAADLLNYRFDGVASLKGHSFGNLLLYTLNELSARPIDSIQLLSRLLKVSNRVLPMSETPTDLVADTMENMRCFGELRIDALTHMPSQLSLSPEVTATPEVIEHILTSELILLGPGSFLTSVMPPLLIEDIQHAIAKSQAQIIYVDNLVAEHSPAGRLTTLERVVWIERYLRGSKINAVISPNAAEITHIPVISNIKAEANTEHRHDAESLLIAIAQAHSQLKP
ncbi:gluconeogenesis factor YvcK family protein [Aliidiomarina quisquiliarum]|uniref:gluconeogenesis factor YvcK family protein n=1 Tax=Aliidiomarina quisquiliarum TaxID=2938947 RepID=UPI00208F6562|nr:uridine diphosphate-N-acetylglucosamine-binding protein YvcK [Aliidiomarina quisquiliarum]MCO4320820.1 uridine diphosphate-N-acetylglucosamine-binding protein YvcK [Aliidiomarina quisquiliarum]